MHLLSRLSYPRSGQLFFEAVRFSFAVAKIEQKLNTNQILPRNIFKNTTLSCIHFPISKQLTQGEKIFRFRGVVGDTSGKEHRESRRMKRMIKRDGHADYPTFPEYI